MICHIFLFAVGVRIVFFGRSMERKCVSEGKVPGVIPCIHADYLYMGSSDVEGTTPILVVKDDHTEYVFANVVPSKGVNECCQPNC